MTRQMAQRRGAGLRGLEEPSRSPPRGGPPRGGPPSDSPPSSPDAARRNAPPLPRASPRAWPISEPPSGRRGRRPPADSPRRVARGPAKCPPETRPRRGRAASRSPAGGRFSQAARVARPSSAGGAERLPPPRRTWARRNASRGNCRGETGQRHKLLHKARSARPPEWPRNAPQAATHARSPSPTFLEP